MKLDRYRLLLILGLREAGTQRHSRQDNTFAYDSAYADTGHAGLLHENHCLEY